MHLVIVGRTIFVDLTILVKGKIKLVLLLTTKGDTHNWYIYIFQVLGKSCRDGNVRELKVRLRIAELWFLLLNFGEVLSGMK